MNQTAFMPIRNTALPQGFRYIRLERARDHAHPEGDSSIVYILILPLDAAARIDVKLYRKYKEACRVVRRRPDNKDSLGHLVHGAGGGWRFHYNLTGDLPDEVGSHFGNERFEAGEYVSLKENDGLNVYRVVSVTPL